MLNAPLIDPSIDHNCSFDRSPICCKLKKRVLGFLKVQKMAKGEMNQKLVYCGSVAWDWIGRRSAKGAPPKEEMQAFEFASPQVYGPAIDLNIKSAITSNTASHCVLIDSNWKFI